MRLRLWDETAVNDSTSTAGGQVDLFLVSFVGRERRKGGEGRKRKEGREGKEGREREGWIDGWR